MNIEEFVATINKSGGLAKQNRYHVVINTDTLVINSAYINLLNTNILQFPEDAVDWINDYLSVDMKDQQRALTAYCEKANLPSYQFATESHRIYGPQFKIPHMPEYQDVTFNFLCGANMAEKYFFDACMYLVMDPISNNFNYLGEYTTNIDIIQYDEVGNEADSNVWWFNNPKGPADTTQTNSAWFNNRNKAPALVTRTNTPWFEADKSPKEGFKTNVIWNNIPKKPAFAKNFIGSIGVEGGSDSARTHGNLSLGQKGPADRARIHDEVKSLGANGPRDTERFHDTTSQPTANYVTTLIDAYPVAVNAMELGYSMSNTVQSVQVTFTYKYALPFDGKESTTNIADRGKRGTLFNQTISERKVEEPPK